MSATDQIHNQRIVNTRPLISPELLRDELPLTEADQVSVVQSRTAVTEVLNGADDRLLVIVGPCSIHDPVAALDYAKRLAAVASELTDQLCIVMRVYFEKPRTTLGWKGLINDPHLDNSFDVNHGLRIARKLLLDIVELGLPVGCEFLDPITPQYIADTVSWGSIGARTAQSQVHRQLSSGLSMPIGIKNSTEGDVQVAVDAIKAAANSHVFPGITDNGLAAIFSTSGNPDCHVILRGSNTGPNYDSTSVSEALHKLSAAGLPERVIIDASHGNSGKDHNNQPVVTANIAERLVAGEWGIVGLMLESFLVSGQQKIVPGHVDQLTYGQSVTDACIDWDTTASLLRTLASAVTKRTANTAKACH